MCTAHHCLTAHHNIHFTACPLAPVAVGTAQTHHKPLDSSWANEILPTLWVNVVTYYQVKERVICDRSFIFFNCLSTYANFYWISSCLSFSLLILSSPTSSWFHPSIEFHLIFHFIMFICIHTIIFLYKYINMTLSNVLVCVCNLFFSSFYLDSFFRFSAHFILSLPYITHVNNAVYILSCFCLGHVRLKLYVKIYMTYGFTSCLTKIES